MIVGGLWHGASINFILWGAVHGLLLIINDMIKVKFNIPKILKIVFVFSIVSFLWIIFRSENIDIFVSKFLIIFSTQDYLKNYSFDLFNMIIGIVMIMILVIFDFIKEFFLKVSFNFRIIISLVFIWIIAFFGIFKGTHFVYFQF